MTNPVSSPQPEGWEERFDVLWPKHDAGEADAPFHHYWKRSQERRENALAFIRTELDRAKREERQRFYDELNAYGAPKGYTGPLPTTEQILEILKDMRPTPPPQPESCEGKRCGICGKDITGLDGHGCKNPGIANRHTTPPTEEQHPEVCERCGEPRKNMLDLRTGKRNLYHLHPEDCPPLEQHPETMEQRFDKWFYEEREPNDRTNYLVFLRSEVARAVEEKHKRQYGHLYDESIRVAERARIRRMLEERWSNQRFNWVETRDDGILTDRGAGQIDGWNSAYNGILSLLTDQKEKPK